MDFFAWRWWRLAMAGPAFEACLHRGLSVSIAIDSKTQWTWRYVGFGLFWRDARPGRYVRMDFKLSDKKDGSNGER